MITNKSYLKWLEKKSLNFLSKNQLKDLAIHLIQNKLSKKKVPLLLVFCNKSVLKEVKKNNFFRYMKKNIYSSNVYIISSTIINNEYLNDKTFCFYMVDIHKKNLALKDIVLKIHQVKSYRHYGLRKIISGGQTGADIGGLMAGRFMKMYVGGHAPKDYITEDGVNYDLKKIYGLEETIQYDYKHRTEKNIFNSSGTIIFEPRTSAGSELTKQLVKKYDKPLFIVRKIELTDSLKDGLIFWIVKNNIKILNVAGNRNSVSPGIRDKVFLFLVLALSRGGMYKSQARDLVNNNKLDGFDFELNKLEIKTKNKRGKKRI